MSDPKDDLLDAALAHVPFDGWSQATLKAAAADTGTDPAAAQAMFPRGGIDLARAFHARGDAELKAALSGADLSGMRFRDRIAHAVRKRLEIAEPHREAVRRGMTLYALPIHAPDGAKALWETADTIWTALGDTSEDYNWYTKRMTLSGVISSTLLYWLGDQSEGHAATWAFLDRRIDDVMQIEKLKAQVNESRLLKPLLAGPNWLLSHVRAPMRMPDVDLPGRWTMGPEDAPRG
ncbi:COQ9 family protein [Rhodobacterales bacterium HKCCE2091]|nr:COQ9 family protein [Rhodobacterales bacterium HKCCE2091]